MKRPVGRFHVITDEETQRRFSHVRLVELAVAGGADTVQFRDKRMGSRALIEAARAVSAVCRAAHVPLIVNDRADVAMAVGADGVHLGRRDLPIAVARRILGPDGLVGGSASSLEEARRVEREGADYVGFGHVFPTASKAKPGPPAGIDALREVCESLSIPVIAIGGIDVENLPAVLDAGAWGVAVIGAVSAAPDPEAAARALAGVLEGRGRGWPGPSRRAERSHG